MRVLLRAAVSAAALSVLLTGVTFAKGEEFTAAIGPIDEITPGTPTQVMVQLTVDGQKITRADIPAYLDFSEPVSRDRLEFPLRWDRAAGTYVAIVTLPHEGRWLVEGLMRYDTASVVAFGQNDGTRVITVRAATAPAAPQDPVVLLLAGAAGTSAAWLLGIGAFVLRRRRATATPSTAQVGEQVPA